MANFNSDQVATLRGKTKADVSDNTTDRQVKPMALGGRLRSAFGRFQAAGEAIASVVRLVWLPFGVTIRKGELRYEAQGASVTAKLGILGVSGTGFDNDDDLFIVATEDLSGAGVSVFPQVALSAVGTGLENKPGNYTVTDPEGAYIILTTAGAVLGTAKDIDLHVEYIND
jgi:hypothetical protein